MKLDQKNLIFQFIEELNSEKKGNYSKEKEIYSKLETLEIENPSLKNEIGNIISLVSSLYSDMKYSYFEYGIMAKIVEESTNFNWTADK